MALLGLSYDRRIPERLLAEMEGAARMLGLPLAAVEHLGRSEVDCRAFVDAWRRGDSRALAALTGVAPVMHLRPRAAPRAVAVARR